MKTLLMLLIYFCITISLYGQTHYVSDKDNKYLEFDKSGQYTFKNHLKDGRWISLNNIEDTTSKHIVAIIKNGLKNGIESKYYYGSKNRYCKIEFENGVKIRRETHWNGNGTIKLMLNYDYGVLNGNIVENWTEGEKFYTGHFSNEFKDSIWTYWETSRKDTVWVYYDKPKKSKEYKYVNGKRYLLNAWNYEDSLMVKNGNGKLVQRDYYIITTEYRNGLKEGMQTRKSFDNSLEYSWIYSKGFLLNKIKYSADGDTISYYNYSYPLPTIIDTTESRVSQYTHKITYKHITFDYQIKHNGLCFEKFYNGSIKFKGNYSDGKRVGDWTWYDTLGAVRMFADYNTETWKYFKKNGRKVKRGLALFNKVVVEIILFILLKCVLIY